MSRISHKITRTLHAAKAPLNAMFCSVLVLGLMMMSSTWCCCLLGMPGDGSTVSESAIDVASLQTSQPATKLLTAGDHSCCVRPTSASTNTSLPASPAAPTMPSAPHDDSSCHCLGQVLDAPTQHLTIHNIASSVSQPMLLLPRLTIAWQLPAVTPSRISSHDLVPTKPGESTLLAQACLLTV